MNWYHRVERRYVEYGSSFEATRAFGLFRATYDIVYNMNMSHLSSEVETFFESLGDAGVRTACTPFLIYRGRTRHELGLDGLLRRGAVAAGFRHAVYGPDEFFFGELFGSRPVPCKPTLARPGTRDDYTACVSKELVATTPTTSSSSAFPTTTTTPTASAPTRCRPRSPTPTPLRRAGRGLRGHRRVPRVACRDPDGRPRPDRRDRRLRRRGRARQGVARPRALFRHPRDGGARRVADSTRGRDLRPCGREPPAGLPRGRPGATERP